MFCPEHDFERDSVQRRILDYFSTLYGGLKHAENDFLYQEERRLFVGFELACEWEFGTDWRTHTEELSRCRLIKQIEYFGLIPDLLDSGQILNDALRKGDWDYIQQAVTALQKAQKISCFEKKHESHQGGFTGLDVGREVSRNWTNPDMPLWLMQDQAFGQAVEYLTTGKAPAGRAIHKRIERFGLKRYVRKPIRSIVIKKPHEGIYQLVGFEFANYLSRRMKEVPICPAFGETGIWRSGRHWTK